MTSNFSDHQKKVLSNLERIEELGWKHNSELEVFKRLQNCPLDNGNIGRRFADKLSHKLDREEFNQKLYGPRIKVPSFDPESSIQFGRIIGPDVPLLIPHRDFTTHGIIVGPSGAGKTNTNSLLADAFIGIIPCIFVDHKDEGGRLLRRTPNSVYIPYEQLRWNCLQGAGSQTEHIRFVAAQFRQFLSQRRDTAHATEAKLLQLCSDKNNLPAVADLEDVFVKLAQNECRSSFITASRGFSDLLQIMGRWSHVRKGRWPFSDHQLSILKMKDISPDFENFFFSLLFNYLTEETSGKPHQTDLQRVVFYDEGRIFFGKEMTPESGSGRVNLQAILMTRMRSYGIGLVICSHTFSSLQPDVLSNAGIIIALNARDEGDAKLISGRLWHDPGQYAKVLDLELGQAWISTPSIREPIKIALPLNELGDYASQSEINRRMMPIWQSWDDQAIFSPRKTEENTAIDFREILGEVPPQTASPAESAEPPEETSGATATPPFFNPGDPAAISDYLAMLRSILAHPDFGLTDHYTALGFSGGRGTRIKSKLLELGWATAESAPAPKGGRPLTILKVSDIGRGVLNDEI